MPEKKKKRNSGKVFESRFRDSAYEHNIFIYRVPDAYDFGAWKTKKGFKNIADFILYDYPYMYFIELKARKANRINFSVFSEHQYEGLLQTHKITGIISGVCFLFTDTFECFYIPINIIKILKESGIKSLNVEESRKYGLELPITKKRVNYEIDIRPIVQKTMTYNWPEIVRNIREDK